MPESIAVTQVRSAVARLVSGFLLSASALGFSPRCLAQPSSPERPIGRQQQKLILVVGVAPNPERRRMTADILLTQMESALKKTNGACTCEGKPIVNRISPVFYAEFNKLVNKAEGASSELLSGEGEGILVDPAAEVLEEFPHVFRLTMREPKKFLYNMKVTYEDGTESEFTPSNANNGQITRAGSDSSNRAQYWIRLKKFPRQYTITAKELGQPDETYSGDWPRTRSHFAVTYKNFQGDFSVLRDRLLDKEIDPISEPIDEIAEFADTRFLLAAVGFSISGPGSIVGKPDNLITVRARPREGIDAVWVKLPFNSDDIVEHLKPWNALKDGIAVIQKLRSEDHDDRVEIRTTELASDTPPKWYRLEKDIETGAFSRTFRLSDQPAFVRQYSPLHVGVIYQTDEGEDALASTIGRDWVAHVTLTERDDPDLISSGREK